MKTPKHIAEQLVSPIIDPPVQLSVTIQLKGATATLWRTYSAHHSALDPSNAQLATTLIKIGLQTWSAGL